MLIFLCGGYNSLYRAHIMKRNDYQHICLMWCGSILCHKSISIICLNGKLWKIYRLHQNGTTFLEAFLLFYIFIYLKDSRFLYKYKMGSDKINNYFSCWKNVSISLIFRKNYCYTHDTSQKFSHFRIEMWFFIRFFILFLFLVV